MKPVQRMRLCAGLMALCATPGLVAGFSETFGVEDQRGKALALASAGLDYDAVGGTLTFAPGQLANTGSIQSPSSRANARSCSMWAATRIRPFSPI